MLSFGFIKKFAAFVLIISAASACRFWQSNNNSVPTPTPENFDEIKSEVPFLTNEPEIFQAEFITIANETERRIFKARNGANRRVDYNFGAENEVIFLQTDKLYTLLPKQKIYAENFSVQTNAVLDETTDFLTNEWLNKKTEAKFEKLETLENQIKYRVLLDGKESSEILIFVDETLKIPVKQEFYSGSGEQKNLQFTFEIRNFKTQTDENLFAVPQDFKKVSAEELYKILKKNE